MTNHIGRLLGGAALAVSLWAGASVAAHAQSTYTSPIDITGGRIHFVAAAPDPDTGDPVEIPLPAGLLGPKINKLMSTPLGAQMDQFWNVIPDPKTGMTPRQQACDGDNGIKRQVEAQVRKIGSGFSAYEISCNLATTGTVVAKRSDNALYLAYLLTNNVVEFTATTPFTCHRDHGTIFCPHDPRFSVTFASEISTVLWTPDICHITAEPGTATTFAVNIDTHNFSGDVARNIIDPLILGNKFSAAERAIAAEERPVPLPLDESLKELRDSAACTDRKHPAHAIVAAFRDLETEIDLPEGIVFRASHPSIAAPRVDGPNPGAPATPPEFPSFARPNITTQPVVVAGSTVQLNGSTFPPTIDLATALPIRLDRDATAACNGGATELEWGLVGGQKQVQELPANGNASTCATHYEITNLTPSTAYQFRARDCDAITCSPWSAPFNPTTAADDSDQGKVVLTLDSGTSLGTASVDDQGTFEAMVTIPADTTAGTHIIHAVSGDAKADTGFEVTTPGADSNAASIVLTGSYYGETGCPTHPLPDYAQKITTDRTFPLFGAGFAPGTVTIHLDSATGMSLGAVAVRTDGTFCQEFQGPPTNLLGAHTLVAVQNGVVQASIPVTVIRPSVVR